MPRQPRVVVASPVLDPAEWRPQQFGRRSFRSIVDPLIEPGWNGVRVIGRFNAGAITLADEDAIDCTAEFSVVAEAMAASALADELVVDGYLTVEATQEPRGVTLQTVDVPSSRQVMAQMVIGGRRPATAAPERALTA